MSAQGIVKTILATQFAEALERDGNANVVFGEHTAAVVRNIAAELFPSQPFLPPGAHVQVYGRTLRPYQYIAAGTVEAARAYYTRDRSTLPDARWFKPITEAFQLRGLDGADRAPIVVLSDSFRTREAQNEMGRIIHTAKVQRFTVETVLER